MQTRAILDKPDIVSREEEGHSIRGYGAVFYDGSPGTEFDMGGVRERIAPTAFDGIEGDDVRAFFNHNPSQVLARTTSGTLRLSVDGRGLRYELDPPDTTLGRDLVELMQRGDVDGSSFMFDILEEEPPRREDGVVIRTITRVKLYEVGPVTMQAYEAAKSEARSINRYENLYLQDQARNRLRLLEQRAHIQLSKLSARQALGA